MEFIKWMGVVVLIAGLAGCASSEGIVKSVAYQEGYQNGICKNLGEMAESMNGNGFPYLMGENWAQPLVQEVRIPAHVRGGVFYPEHNELVIITPGEWTRSAAFPVSAQVMTNQEKVQYLSADITGLPRVIMNEKEIK